MANQRKSSGMDKRDYEIGKLSLIARITESVVKLFQTVAICAAAVLAIYFIMNGCVSMSDKNPSSINALSNFVEKFKLGTIFGYALAGLCGAGYWYERKGKKRAIQEKAHYQKIAEKNDPDRPSSGLTSTGQTPKDNE
ncbi:MAG: hypothetical protein QM715_18575 [Nibricoccus sp.]